MWWMRVACWSFKEYWSFLAISESKLLWRFDVCFYTPYNNQTPDSHQNPGGEAAGGVK